MCRKMLWFYVIILTLLDISVKTKLAAQGKSHGVMLHDSLIEGISFQEWGGEAEGSAPPEGLALEPPALHFGAAALAAPHARTVTLINTANTTLHLASVAGTTPDFHASFFESKTLAPRGNTSFSVVYLGRREGPATAHLYIHTSLGVHKYPVSAVGVASEYDIWPLVGVRVPANATVEPVLTLYNPTDYTIQVSEVYSSGAWVGLQLPEGGDSAPRAAWAVPSRTVRDIVRLRLTPPPGASAGPVQRPLTAYVRLKANIPGGALVVCVEARPAAAGEHAAPLQLHMRTRGAADPPLTVTLRAANSARSAVQLEAALRDARCVPAPHTPPEPCATHHAHAHNDYKLSNGEVSAASTAAAGGARLTLLRAQLEPLQQFTEVAQLMLNYSELWRGAEGEGGGGGGGVREARCAGCVRIGRAALPYTLRLLPGTLRLEPREMHFVTSSAVVGAEAAQHVGLLRAHNDCPLPLHLAAAELSSDAAQYFQMTEAGAMVLQPGASAVVARLRLSERALQRNMTLDARLTLRTNLSHYVVPVLVYSGRFALKWEWPWGADGEADGDGSVSLGALGTSASRRVGVWLRNPSPAQLCARELAAELSAGSAQLTLAACPAAPAAPPDHACRCVEPGGLAQGWLVVVAPARAGMLHGQVRVRSQHATTRAVLTLRALTGRLHAHPLLLPAAAPYAWSSAEIILESTMELEMFVINVTQPAPAPDPALTYKAAAGGRAAVRAGQQPVGSAQYAPESHCHPDCYTGIDFITYEGSSWLARAAVCTEASLNEDVEMVTERLAKFQRQQREQPAARNLTLYVHTTEVVQIPVSGSVRLHWPRVAGAAAAGAGGVLAALGMSRTVRVSARNPSSSHALLMQPVVAGDLHLPDMAGGSRRCENGSCVWAPHAFRLAGWRGVRGRVSEWAPAPPARGPAGPVLLLAPLAHVEFTLTFTPHAPAPLAAYLYLRNNLTVLEGVVVSAEGVQPSFELAGRRPGSAAPILFEVTECGGGAGAASVRRAVLVRNTGRVPLRLRDWRVAGHPCHARGFRVEPCATFTLAPNESRALQLAFAPDFALARVAARLQLRSEHGRADFTLQAAVPVRLLPRCAAAAPRPPWEPALRAATALVVFAALALVLAAAAFDAERLLRRARASRAQSAPRAPLDLRAATCVHERPAPAAPHRAPPARRRRPPRRPLPPLDPLAERRAFEQWRAEVLRRADDDESRSSEDADSVSVEAEPHPSPPPSPAPLIEQLAPSHHDDAPFEFEHHGAPTEIGDFEEPDREGDDEEERPSNSGDEYAVSTGSDMSSPASDRGEAGERSEPEDNELVPDRESPANIVDEKPAPDAALPCPCAPSAEMFARATRPRRESGEPVRRTERSKVGGEAAPVRTRTVKPHARKEKSAKRRGERPSAPPSRGSPAHAEPEPAGPTAGGAGAVSGGAVRWGASWSSVVAARALAPIGSDVPRRTGAAAGGPATSAGAAVSAANADTGDHSLFYFNGSTSTPRAELTWRAPALDHPYQAARDYLEEASGVGSVGSVGTVGSVGSVGVGGGGYGTLSGAWGSAWAWGAAGAVRPPPGFAAPPRPPRAYDPFRSLASIWAPGAVDWRFDASDPVAATTGAPTTTTGTTTSTSASAADLEDR